MACNRNGKAEPKEILGLHRITKKRLLELCKKNKLYQTPSLNDVLYLHYQGFQSIECLEEYTELKCLWLECNAISEIQGLDNQIKLKCLFLQSNLIKKIENLEYCKELDTINLSQNHIRKIENCGFDVLPVLNTLNIASNYIKDSEGLKELENCTTLSVLDLSNNRIDDILVVKIFSKMPELKVLVLQGNPVVSKIPQYRKTMTLECKKLTYLDSRPVFPKDRACAEAWKRGGYEEERKENERWNRRERKKMRDSVNATIRLRNKNRKPEDILSLLTSSDSEDESDAKKNSRRNDLGTDVSIDSIWDEVAEDSSDLNVSSSTSETSTTDSNGLGNSSDGKYSKIEEQKILNDNNDNNTKVCHFAANEDMESIVQFKNESGQDKPLDIDVKQIVEHYESIELKKHDNLTLKRADQEDEIKDKPKKINIHNGDLELGKHLADNFDASDKGFGLNESSSSSRHSNNSLCSAKDQYKDTIDAICLATMNNLSETENFSTTPLRSVQLQIETLNVKDDENYEPLKELEETMNILIKKEDSEREAARQENFPSLNKNTLLTVETPTEEYSKKDFEKFSSDMDYFMLKLQKDKEERQEAMEILFDKKEMSKESSSDSSEHEHEENMDERKLENVVSRLMKGKRIVETRQLKEVPEIWINDEPYQEENIENFEACEESCTNSQLETVITKKEIREKITSKISADSTPHKPNKQDVSNNNNVATDIDNSLRISIKKQEPPVENKTDLTMEQLFPSPNLSHENNVNTLPTEFEYIPMDISLLTRNSHYALNSIEKEANELKVLLQKLEDENMDLFKEFNIENKCHAEEQSKENSFKDVQEDKLQEEYMVESDNSIQYKYDEQITMNSTNDMKTIPKDNGGEQLTDSLQELEIEKLQGKQIPGKNEMDVETPKSSVGEQLIEEIIQCLELKTAFKPRSYELDIISDEEFSYSEPIVERENLPFTKPIPDFLETFNQFSKTISNEKKVPTADPQKLNSLQELANRRKIQDFNTDSHKSLDAQLELLKEKQTKQIRRMVDRVYAQKERYNDTLELIDGKLMVRNKDTGEVKELPPPPRHLSDSDTEYDTAQSEEENDGARCRKQRQLINDGSKQRGIFRNDQSAHENTKDQSLRNCEVNWGFNRNKSDGWPISHKPTPRKSAEHLITQALEYNRTSDLTRNGFDDSSSDESQDEFYSLDSQNKSNLYGNIDKEFFNTLTLDQFKRSEHDEHHINQCARSYEDMKKCLILTKGENCSDNENNELVDKIKVTVHRQIQGNRENVSQILQNNDSPKEDLLLKKLMQRTKEKVGFENSTKEVNRNINDVDIDRMPYKICKAVKIYEYKYENNDHNASTSNQPVKTLNEIPSATESVMDNFNEVFGNNVFSFVFEEQEKTSESIEEIKRVGETESIENEEELNRQDFMQNLMLRNLSFQKVKAEEEKLSSTDLNSPKSADSILCPEKYSEEEKNEIESNVDVEGIVMNNNLAFVRENECSEEILNKESIPNSEYNIETRTKMEKVLNQTDELDIVTQSSEGNRMISNTENCIQTISSITGKTSLNTSAQKNFPDGTNTSIVFNEANSQEEQSNSYEDHEDCIATGSKTPCQAINHVSEQSDTLTETPRSSVTQCTKTPPNSKVTTQQIIDKLPIDNYTEKSQNSTENSKTLQEDAVNSQTPSQNTDVKYEEPEIFYELPTSCYRDKLQSSFNIDQSKVSSQNLESMERLETPELELLECNLEIIGCNEEIIDTITVNAEVHYDY